MKVCSQCNKEKDLDQFYKNHRLSQGVHNICIDCCRIRSKKYEEANKDKRLAYRKSYNVYNRERRRAYDIQNKYGLSAEQYEALLEKQNNVCAICKSECSTFKTLSVDHDHSTGKVRGLLCNDCNTGLGKFKDNKDLLASAVEYLNV